MSLRSESSSSGSRSNADEASPERESTSKRLQQSGKSSKSWADEVEDEEERRETSRGLEAGSNSRGRKGRQQEDPSLRKRTTATSKAEEGEGQSQGQSQGQISESQLERFAYRRRLLEERKLSPSYAPYPKYSNLVFCALFNLFWVWFFFFR